MSIIIRLQNLAWSASSVDIRRFFTGLSIPEGGVHIVGGEKGDAFIAFSTDEDARLAMEKDGGKIKEMKIKLLLSSRAEMMRVIEQARQQNVTPQPVDSDRRKGAGASRPERSPSPRSRRSSPGRDKRRSSKRERSRSRSRSPGRRSRDVDRRNNNDRSRRDDRRPDEGAPRFNRDERPKRDTSRDHERKNENANYYDQRGQKNYPFPADSKIPAFDARNNTPQNDPGMMPYRENRGEMSLVPPPLGYQRGVVPPEIKEEKEVFDKRSHPDASLQDKPRRKSRFDSEFPSESDGRFFSASATDNEMRKPLIHGRDPNLENDPNIAYNRHEPSVPFGMRDDGNRHESRIPPFGIREDGNRPWPRETENGDWVEKRPGLLDPPRVPVSKNKDFVQVVPMDLDDEQNSPERSIEQGQFHRPPFGNHNPSNRDRVQNAGLPFARNENQQPNALLRNNQESVMDSRKFLGGPGHTEESNFVVRVRGLNQNATESDVLHLFRGIRLFPENITLEADSDGLLAYAQFLNASDFDEALSRNMQFIGRNRVQISSCMSTTKRNIPPNLPLRPKDLCVQLRGLPLAGKEDSIAHFFNGLAILDLFIEREGDGRPTGIGYVEFSKVEDFHASLSMNGTLLGHHVISVIEVTKELKIIAKRESMKKQEQFQYEQNPPPIKPQRPPQQGIPMCIVMRGLPETVLNRDIADFFSEVNVIPRAIHIMLKNKIPSGDAFAELCNTKDVDHALQQNGKFLIGVRISVTPITFQEMTEIMGRPAAPNASEPLPMMPPKVPLMQPHAPELMEPPHVSEHPHHMQSRPQAPALLRTPVEANDRPRPLIATEPLQPLHGEGRVFMERFQPPRGPPFPRMRGAGFRGRPPMRPYGSDGHPPRGPRLFPPRSERPSRYPRNTGPPPSTQGGPQDFGSPGCVVGINNLHFHAGLEELLKFFEDYSPGKDSIIRKYNEHGQTTGEARIAFQNPDDAQRAVKELNHKTIMGRPLNLCVM